MFQFKSRTRLQVKCIDTRYFYTVRALSASRRPSTRIPVGGHSFHQSVCPTDIPASSLDQKLEFSPPPPSPPQAPLSPSAITNICVSSNGEQNFLVGTKLWWRQFYICCCCFFTFPAVPVSLSLSLSLAFHSISPPLLYCSSRMISIQSFHRKNRGKREI